MASSYDAAAQASSKLELWRNNAQVWGSTLHAENASYPEDGIIPGRFVATLTGGSYSLAIKYDFSDGGANRFVDYLATFNASEPAVNPAAGVSNAGTPSQWLLPIDPAVGVDRQTRHYPQGRLTTYNVSSLTFGNYTQVGGVRMLTVNFVVPGNNKQKRNVVVAWGVHLADDVEWAPGSGAGTFPGASRKIYTSLNGAADENVSINPNVITMALTTDLEITKLIDIEVEPVLSGDLLTYYIQAVNRGTITATGVTVTDLLPVEVALVNAVQSQGTLSIGADSALNFALGDLAPGALAAIQINVQIDSSFVGTLSNTASVTAVQGDPDLANNSATALTVVTDGTAPVVNCPGNITVNTDPMSSTATVTFAATATDNVGVASLTYSKASGSAFQIGTTTVTVTATDAAGNSSECSFTVTVRDEEAPVVACPANVVVGTDDGLSSAVVSFAAIATDNSGFAPMVSYSPEPGSAFPLGTTTVTVTATDLDGNSAQCSFTVTVVDDEAPQIVCPADIVVGNDAGLPTAVVEFAATATDNVGAVVSFNPASGSVFPLGETTVTATATDAAGLTAQCTFTVTVEDREAPTITAPADVVAYTAFGAYQAVVSYDAPQAADNASSGAGLVVGCSIASGTELEVGIYTITCTATDQAGNVSDEVAFTATVADQFNIAWPLAHTLEPLNDPSSDVLEFEARQFLIETGQSRWYKFKVKPGSKLVIALTELAENYDLVLFGDIAAKYQELTSPTIQDLVQLGAEFAPEAFSPAAFSPEAFSPAAFSPAAFSPAAFSPAAFSPAAFSPAAFSPEAFSPAAFSPEAFSPEAFSPAAFSPAAFSPAAFSPLAFSPAAFSPAAFSPAAFSPAAFSPAAFSSAQTLSVIGVSAFPGLLGDGLIVNTWNESGEFYIRVRGRNGVFTKDQPFRLNVELFSGQCGDVEPVLTSANTQTPTVGDFKTIILTDSTRLTGVEAAKLTALAARTEVKGVIIDVGQYNRVIEANAQADANPECPIAKNLVAEAIKEIVDGYWAINPLEYIVIVGGDEVIPFYRHPDQALLANENNYVPPVFDSTPSQASLKLGFILGQDAYGAHCEIRRKTFDLPLPSLAVGRLVEEPADIHAQLDAYLATAGGVVPQPDSALVAAYDFLSDVGYRIRDELTTGLGVAVSDSLIAPAHEPPSEGWTATELKAELLGPIQHDLVFFGGHFSSSAALAADYTTRFTTAELMASSASFLNSIIFSSGCHSGYNVVNEHGIPGVTGEPDWAQAFALKGATLIAGTGYQYGDTDFIEYSEQIYLNFARNLRAGTGPVAVGKALVNAKNTFLSQTPQLRGIHEKSMLIATLFGLPMLSVDLPEGRGSLPTSASVVGALDGYAADPGLALGLQSADISVATTLERQDPVLINPEDGTEVTTTYYSGLAGVVANPAEPVLPLETVNVSAPGTVLRGVGFLGGTYADLANVIPHTGAPATEIRGVHAPFLSDVLFPVRLWNVNYFDVLCQDDVGTGATRLLVTPSQFISAAPGASTGTIRTFSDLSFRLFYSANTTTYGLGTPEESVPAFVGAPNIVQVTDEIVGDQVDITVQVVGNPTAGMQNVWITYTVDSGTGTGTWQSLFLTQNVDNSSFWQGALPLNGVAPSAVRYLVQAVNGVGLVSMDANLGEFFEPGQTFITADADAVATVIELQAPLPTTGVYNQPVPFSARLTTATGEPLANQRITFGLGTTQRQAYTDADGFATVEFPLLSLPGEYDLQATFRGTRSLLASLDSAPFVVSKRATVLLLEPANLPNANPEETGLFASLREVDNGDSEGAPLQEKTVIFIVNGPAGLQESAVITDYLGRALLVLPSGSFNISAYFSGTIPFASGNLNLNDDRYEPAVAGISVFIDGDAPVFDNPDLAVGFTAEATGPDGAIVTFEVTASDNSGESPTVESDPVSGSLFPLGTTPVTATASDTVGNTASVTFPVTVEDTTAPVITVPASIVAAATGSGGASVNFVTSATDLVDGNVPTVNSPASGSLFPLGTTTVTTTATDAAGNVATKTFTVTVQDLTAPVIQSITANPAVIKQFNHKMVKVTVSVTATDDSGLTPTSRIIGVSSNEPENGLGDGDQSPDWEITGPLTVDLRAERSNNGTGRVYTITVECRDAAGNATTGTVTVFVPKNNN